MTQVCYKCFKDSKSEPIIVSSLPKAQEFVKENGGRYEISYTEVRSDSEAFARDGSRSKQYDKMH